jgi:hypothetical protein
VIWLVQRVHFLLLCPVFGCMARIPPCKLATSCWRKQTPPLSCRFLSSTSWRRLPDSPSTDETPACGGAF